VKLTPLVLAGSLIANLALVAALVLRAPTSSAPGPAAPDKPVVGRAGDKSAEALRAALASGDAAALEAAGLPAEAARQLAVGRAFSRLTPRQGSRTDGRWWRSANSGKSREQELVAQRELSDALVALLGYDPLGFGGANSELLSFLPPAKREALRRITQDYDEMMAKFSATGIQLPSDREKLRLLRAERERDIAAALTPAEFADYELRMSPSAANVRARFGDALESEDDFRKVFALQKAYDEKFPSDSFTGRVTPEMMQQRSAAERQLQDDIRAALGDDRYAALRRASDSDLRNVESLATRLNLPADTTNRVATARDQYALESQRIMANAALDPAQRRAQILDLGTKAKADLVRTLGAEAADAYSQRSPWMSMLQGGIGYTTDPRNAPPGAVARLGGQTVFPVMPAGATGPGATRQVVNVVGGVPGAPTDGGMFFLGGTPQPRENVQVISVMTGETRTTAPATGSTSTAAPAPAPPPPR
jgi:hypothetical protein